MLYSRRVVVSSLIASITVALVGAFRPCLAADAPAGSEPVYIGTFTGKGSKGIYLVWLQPESGKLSGPELVAEAESPSYLALHPSGRFLYSVNEIDDWQGKKTGAVSAFVIANDFKKLTLLNQQSSGGPGPTYISLDHTGKIALIANYAGGSVAALPIDADGKLRAASAVVQHKGTVANPKRQGAPHAHCFDPDPANNFALACDLGLDKVFVYHIDTANGSLKPNDPPSGSTAKEAGPRHLAFHPSGKFVYVIDEIASNITAFAYDGKRGALSSIQTLSTLPADFHGENSTAEIMIHPSGKFIYGSNRGHNSIAIFSVDAQSGKLTAAGHQSTQGKTPRGFGIDPKGRVLIAANQDTNNLTSYRIDSRSGALAPVGSLQVPTPVCVTFPVVGR